ncbi:MAG: hypothetical protein DLM68_11110, partial [Hyphomicrobiales bacterium]
RLKRIFFDVPINLIDGFFGEKHSFWLPVIAYGRNSIGFAFPTSFHQQVQRFTGTQYSRSAVRQP